VTAAQIQLVSLDPTKPNSATNPVVDPVKGMALFASTTDPNGGLAGCPTSVNCPFQYTQLSNKETTISPKAALSYEFTPGNMAYFTYAKGFRPGGVNPPISPLQCPTDFQNLGITATPLTFNQDQVNNYEIGDKARMLDGKLQVNSALFYIQWKGMQYNQTLGCGLAFINSSADAISKGAEIQINGRFGPWNLGGNASYNNAYYSHSVYSSPNPAPTAFPVNGKGDGLPGIPLWTANINVQRGFALANMPGYVRWDWNYTGKAQTGGGPLTNGFNPLTYMRKDYMISNMRLGLTAHGIDWSVYVNNVLNNHKSLTVGTGPSRTGDSGRTGRTEAGSPRVVGIQASYRF
jgi:outer membrane receptor protein involved in Fe transport